MRTRTPRSAAPRTLLGAVGLACLLAGCGSSARTPSPATATRTVTATVTRNASAPATSTGTSAVSTPTTTSAPPQPAGDRCVAADLALRFLGGNGATGHDALGFALRNTSAHGCRTGGYPGIQFLDAAGRPLPTHPVHTTDDLLGHTALRELTIAPGQSASFRLVTTDIGSGGGSAGCARATTLQVIAPNDTATMRVGLRAGVFECQGKVTVSPVLAGASPMTG
jgi:hypothetical protein